MERIGVTSVRESHIRSRKLRKNHRQKIVLYVLIFLFTLHITPSIYIDSSFLSQFLKSDQVGLVYSAASLLTLIGFVLIRRLLTRIGNYKTFMSFLIVDLIILGVMSLSLLVTLNQIWGFVFITAYIIGFVVRSLALLNIDILLEEVTSDKETGNTRGLFLTFLNLAFIIGPLVAGLLIVDVLDAGRVYLWGAIFLIPVILLTRKYFKDHEDPRYAKSQIWNSIKMVFKNANLHRIFAATFLLKFFFAWMVIYTPIFLTSTIGFELKEVGLMMAIALLPFVLLEYILGKIADEKLGEKEILTAGFVVISLATGLIFFIDSSSFAVWASILFVTRIGASMIEIMSETYLFKKIDSDDISIIGLHRSIRPFAYILGPVTASILLIFVDIRTLFIILAFIMLFGLYYSLTLKDTK